MHLLKPINLRNMAKNIPYFIYKQLTLTEPRAFFYEKLPAGYGYLLRNVIVGYNDVDAAGTAYNQDLSIEFFDNTTFQARQVLAVPVKLISSPCDFRPREAAPTAGVFPARSVASSKMLNFFYPWGDLLNVQVTGQVSSEPPTVDVVLVGYLLPEGSAPMMAGEGY